MTPIDKDGQWYNDPKADSVASVASAARTTTATSAQFSVEDINTIEGQLVVTAVSGTGPTLVLKLQVSNDGTTWEDAIGGTWPSVNANGTYDRTVDAQGWKFARWSWTIAGTTPSFTFRVDALDKKGGVA